MPTQSNTALEEAKAKFQQMITDSKERLKAQEERLEALKIAAAQAAAQKLSSPSVSN